MRRVCAVLMCVAVAASSPLAAVARGADAGWSADPAHSAVTMSVAQVFSTVRGTIPIASGSVETDGDSVVPVKVEVTLRSATMTTGDAGRDAELRSERFFDAERFPTIVFTSERVEPRGPQRFLVDGTLAMRGTAHALTFDTHVAWVRREDDGRRRVRYEGTAHFRRSDYGMTYARPVVGNDVRLDLGMEVVAGVSRPG